MNKKNKAIIALFAAVLLILAFIVFYFIDKHNGYKKYVYRIKDYSAQFINQYDTDCFSNVDISSEPRGMDTNREMVYIVVINSLKCFNDEIFAYAHKYLISGVYINGNFELSKTNIAIISNEESGFKSREIPYVLDKKQCSMISNEAVRYLQFMNKYFIDYIDGVYDEKSLFDIMVRFGGISHLRHCISTNKNEANRFFETHGSYTNYDVFNITNGDGNWYLNIYKH